MSCSVSQLLSPICAFDEGKPGLRLVGPYKRLRGELFSLATETAILTSSTTRCNAAKHFSGYVAEIDRVDAFLLCGSLADIGTTVLCYKRCPPKTQLLELLFQTALIAKIANPPIGGSPPLKSHIVVLMGDTPSLGRKREEQRLFNWLIRVEPSYDDNGKHLPEAELRNTQRMALWGSFASLHVSSLPSLSDAFFREQAETFLMGELVAGHCIFRVHEALHLSRSNLWHRLQSLRAIMSSSTDIQGVKGEWAVAVASSLTSEFNSVGRRNGSLQTKLICDRLQSVTQRCSRLLALAQSDSVQFQIHSLIRGAEARATALKDDQRSMPASVVMPSSSAMTVFQRLADWVPYRYKFWVSPQGLGILVIFGLFLLGTIALMRRD